MQLHVARALALLIAPVVLAAACAPGVVGGSIDVDGGAPGSPNGGPVPGVDAGVVGASGGNAGTATSTGGAPGVGPVTGSGTGGRSGSVGGVGTGGNGSTTTGTGTLGLPCDIQTLLQAHCTTCHGTTLNGGAPMPLVTYANLTTYSTVYPSMTFAERALIRVQAATGQMPPAPAARLLATEIQGLSSWIAARYPMGTCGGTTTGTGTGGVSGGTTTTGTGTGGARATGTGGVSGGVTGSGGGAAPTGTSGTLPCDVQTLLQNRCTTCHAATPTGGAPMSLVTYANVTARSTVDPALTYAQRALVRMQDNASPMPPAPGTRATTTEIQAVSNWVAAGYPSGAACAGTGGAGGTPTPDPFSVTARCTSNTFWTGGNDGSASMNPGRACIACHRNGGGEDDENEAPLFAIAGTVYPTAHEPDLCNGVNGTTGARIVVVDAANRTITLTPNAAGNFTYTGALTTPFHAKVTYQGRERIMTAAQTSGDCNGCHTQNGANGAPGRITLP
jgi:mono/diheme cytochrome c family protein